MRGSSPTTSWLRLRSTASATLSENWATTVWLGVGRAAHAAKATPFTAAMTASRSRATTRSSGGGRRRKEAMRSNSSTACRVEPGAPVAPRPRRARPRSRDARRPRAGPCAGRRRLPATKTTRIMPGLERRHDEAGAQSAGARELVEPLRHRSSAAIRSRSRAASSKRRSAASRRRREPQAREGSARIVALESVQRPRGAAGERPAGERPVRRRLAAAHPAGAAAPQVDMPVRPRAARVRRRPELAQQAQLIERRLELAPARAATRRARARPAPPRPRAAAARRRSTSEVGPRGRVPAPRTAAARGRRERGTCPGAAGSTRDEAALGVQPPGARRGELDEIGDRLGAALLGEPDQRDQDLGRGCGVRQRPVARLGRRAEEVGQAREAEVPRPALEQPSREPDRVDHGRRDPPPGQAQHGVVEEGHVEARVVRDEHGVAREREETAHGEIRARRSADVSLADARQGRDRGRQRHPRVRRASRTCRRRSSASTRCAPISTMREPRGREPGRLQVEDDERGRLERDGGARRIGEPHRGAAPLQPRVTGDDLIEQRASDRRRGAEARAKRARAASVAGTGPCPASTSSTSRSAASNESCIPSILTRTCVRVQFESP